MFDNWPKVKELLSVRIKIQIEAYLILKHPSFLHLCLVASILELKINNWIIHITCSASLFLNPVPLARSPVDSPPSSGTRKLGWLEGAS